MRKTLLIVFVIVLLIIGVNGNLLASRKLTEKTMGVRITIPSVQKLEVIDDIRIDNVRAELENRENGQPVIIENASTVRVSSNDDWRLEFHNTAADSSYDVFVRADDGSGWQNVSQETGSIGGTNGSQLVNFDLMIESNTTDLSDITGGVELRFTLGQV